MKAKISRQELEQIWASVPTDYYQQGTKKNFLQHLWHSGKLKAVISLISIKPTTILDVGCASGWFLSHLKHHFPRSKCFGVDVYAQSVNYGNKLYPQLTLKTADAHKLPFPAKSFDLVVCTEVLEHVVDPLLVLKEIKRVAKPSSEIIIEMDSGNWLFHSVWFFWTRLKGHVWHNAHIQVYTAKRLERDIEKSGLTILKSKYFNLNMGVAYQCQS